MIKGRQTPIVGGYVVPYRRTVQEEQSEERSRSPYGRVGAPIVGHETRMAMDGPIVVAGPSFVEILWHRISLHSARVSQQKLALLCLL